MDCQTPATRVCSKCIDAIPRNLYSPPDLKSSLQNNGPFVLDVRTPGEWKSNHIDGATHAPLLSFAKKIPDLPKDQRIAVICGSGYRSSIAGSMLQARGYKTIENVTGGMEAYEEVEE